MITSIPVRIASGDAAPTGVGWLGPGGLGWRGGSAPWVDVAMIGPTECHRMKHPKWEQSVGMDLTLKEISPGHFVQPCPCCT